MAMNRVQFQKGLSLSDFLEKYGGTEQKCRAHLEKARWPKGFVCHHCNSNNYSVVWHGEQKTFQCNDCRKQTTLTAGTIFEHTKLPLMKWFQAFYFLTCSKNNVSALELMRVIGVCYRSAWRMKHKITQVMREREEERVLSGEIQLDDVYLGGECSDGKAGRGSENKVPFLAAVETNEDGNPIHAVFSPVNSFSLSEIEKWAKKKLGEKDVVTTDGLNCFNALKNLVHSHKRIVVGTERKSTDLKCFKWVNTLIGNLKNAMTGTYHAFDFKKYGGRYLAEAQYRFNRRFDLDKMFIRLLYASAQTGPRPEKWLRLAEA